MTKEEKIKEVMELVKNAVHSGIDLQGCKDVSNSRQDDAHVEHEADIALVESKLRELIQ